jgi:hypothetical protein
MDLHVVATTGSGVLQAIGTTLSMLKNARDLAKESKNHELKDVISDAFDSLLDLRERMLALDEENRELKLKLAKKGSFSGPVPPFGYMYKDGDMQHPFCPKCFQEKGHEYPLSMQSWAGSVRRDCRNCKWYCIE